MKNDLTSRLGLRYPILQGPFGGTASSPGLLAAVSNAGGLGAFGAHVRSPVQIGEFAAEARRLAPGKPFGINLWVSSVDGPESARTRESFESREQSLASVYEEVGVSPPGYPASPDDTFASQVEAVLRAKPAVFSFVFGIPTEEVLRECRRRGIYTIGAATTVEEAQAVAAAGVDAVVASGFEAGGHRPSFLREAEDSLHGTMALVRAVVQAVEIPVIAAGGAGVAAALRLGAQAAQIGTAFLACEESGADPLQREMLFAQPAHRTRLSRSVSGRLARFIDNPMLRKLEASGAPLPYPAQGWLTSAIRQAAAEASRGELGLLYAGQGAGFLRHRKAVELVAALARDAGLGGETAV